MGRVEVDIVGAVAREDVLSAVSDVHRLGDWVTVHRGD
jgi:hydrogenase maturation factor